MIPTKDRRDLLERCLKSALDQTIPADEIIVVNDGSNDGTKEFLDAFTKDHPTVRIIHREKNGGVNTARNEGMKIVKSTWTANLDDDDEFLPTTIEIMKRRIATLPDNFGAAYFNTRIDNGEEVFTGGFQTFDGKDHFDPTYEQTMLKYGLRGDCRPVYRTDLFSKGGYWYPEGVNGFESIQTTRIARDGVGIRYFPDISTKVNLRRDISHLSFSMNPAKARQFVRLHREQLADHAAFYRAHRDILARKYVTIMSLARRSGQWWVFLWAGLGVLQSRLGFGLSAPLLGAIEQHGHDRE
ncbi:MAG TPA: glycosyltransferase [Verrucomicrobiae bacterium]|nr:glycosyltransferase [Verrucomicrobiae bacterium]